MGAELDAAAAVVLPGHGASKVREKARWLVLRRIATMLLASSGLVAGRRDRVATECRLVVDG
jgi:hypothetical protein